MDLADSWLGVPKLLTPEEIVNPNVDEMSMMTYLSQFPNAKVTPPLTLYTAHPSRNSKFRGKSRDPSHHASVSCLLL